MISARERKESLIAKKRELTKQMREMRTMISALKRERDDLNLLVKRSKTEREKSNNKLKGMTPGGSVKVLEKRLKDLEWKYQIEATTREKDKKMSEEIRGVEERLKYAREFDSLGKAQKSHHENVLKHAKESEERHQKLLRLYEEIEKTEAKRNSIDKKIDEVARELKAEEKGIDREKRKWRKSKDRKKTKERQIVDEKARKAEEKLKKGGKITTEELLALQMKVEE